MAHIQLRINYDEKQAAQQVLDDMGLTMSGAIKLFLKQVVKEQGLPFALSSGMKKNENQLDIEAKKDSIVKDSIPKVEEEWSGFSTKKIG